MGQLSVAIRAVLALHHCCFDTRASMGFAEVSTSKTIVGRARIVTKASNIDLTSLACGNDWVCYKRLATNGVAASVTTPSTAGSMTAAATTIATCSITTCNLRHRAYSVRKCVLPATCAVIT